MIANEPSKERVNAAAWAMQREDPVPMQMFTFDEICDLARAALIADAPVLVEARIAGMREARDLAAQQLREGRALLAVQVINHTITALQADLDKERGKTI